MIDAKLAYRGSSLGAAVVMLGLAGCGGPAFDRRVASDGPVIALNDSQLAKARGGFDISPNLQINFGFEQVTSVNHQVVARVIVPTISISTQLTHDMVTIPPVVTPVVVVPQIGALSAPVSTQTADASVPNPVQTGTGSQPGTTSSADTAGVGSSANASNAGGAVDLPQIATVTSAHPSSGVVNVQTVTTNQGATSVSTILSNSGITNLISNNADGALVQQATTIQMELFGLSNFISKHNASMALTNALNLSNMMPH